jgi:hypothetical protein
MNEHDIIAKLTSRRLLGCNRYVLMSDRLVHEWDYRNGNQGKVHYVLSSLSPELYTQRTFAHEARGPLRRGFFLLALGVAVLLSDFRRSIPLLAPILLVCGAGPFVAGCAKFRDQVFTVVQRPDGSRVMSIRHRGCPKDERERFEALFTETVRGVKPQQTESSQQPAGQVSSEAAPSASSDEPSA